MFELPTDRTPDRIEVLTRWLPRIAVSMAFLAIGSQKFTDAYWTDIFEQIGLGQWFRYFTGALQIAGAALAMIPRTG